MAQLQDARLVREDQHLHEQLRDLGQKRLPELGYRRVIRMQPTRNKAKRHGLVGGRLNLARTEHARCIPIEQQAQQHFRCERLTADRRIPRVETTQIQQANNADDEPRQMVERQAVTERNGLLERFCIVDGFEFAGHVRHTSRGAGYSGMRTVYHCAGAESPASPTGC
jgi:hypothetical protein